MKSRKICFLLMASFFLVGCQTMPAQVNNGNNIDSAENKTVVLSDQYINIKHRDNKAKPSPSDNYTALGAGYLAKENYEKAMLKLQRAIKLDTTNARAYNYLGILYWKLDEYKLAESNFLQSHKLSPYDAAINHNYGSFQCEQGNFEEGKIYYNKVFKNTLYDRLSQAHSEFGHCAIKQNQMELAKKHLQTAIKQESRNTNALIGMAKLFYRQQKYKLSLYYYERYIDKEKQTPDRLWLGINIRRQT
ncbi:MAG: tetratricopeptide repeat protein, partial [Gammaproteobacteria bacterium]|nr:tetratricopeptide repeat protein [Gammaproteobacteria bacterium]